MNLSKLRMIFPLVLLVCLICFANCNGSEGQVERKPAKEHGDTPAYTSTYVCPMHCAGSGSSEAGLCPGCGMDYVLLRAHTKNGHSH